MNRRTLNRRTPGQFVVWQFVAHVFFAPKVHITFKAAYQFRIIKP